MRKALVAVLCAVLPASAWAEAAALRSLEFAPAPAGTVAVFKGYSSWLAGKDLHKLAGPFFDLDWDAPGSAYAASLMGEALGPDALALMATVGSLDTRAQLALVYKVRIAQRRAAESAVERLRRANDAFSGADPDDLARLTAQWSTLGVFGSEAGRLYRRVALEAAQARVQRARRFAEDIVARQLGGAAPAAWTKLDTHAGLRAPGRPELVAAGIEARVRAYRIAALQGSAPAHLFLAGAHERGLSVPPDPVKALAWSLQAGALGDKDARPVAARLLSSLSLEDVSRAEKNASRFLARLAARAARSKPERPVNNFVLRVITGAAYAGVTLAAIRAGGAFFSLYVAAAAALALNEYRVLLRSAGRLIQPVNTMRSGLIFVLAAALGWAPGEIAPLLLLSFCFRELLGKTHSFERAARSFFGAVLIGGGLSYLILIRRLPHGALLASALFASIWAADTFAFVVGKTWGRHKLAPQVSPGKTWEGALGGAAAAVAAALIFHACAPAAFGLVRALGLGLIVAGISPVSDLAESVIKREIGVKDSGTGLPGHGGFLDRYDSLLLTAAVAYYFLLHF